MSRLLSRPRPFFVLNEARDQDHIFGFKYLLLNAHVFLSCIVYAIFSHVYIYMIDCNLEQLLSTMTAGNVIAHILIVYRLVSTVKRLNIGL